MKAIALFVALGLAILAGTFGAYLALGGSIHGSDLPNFGTFVGGVGGALLNFLALIALVWTIRLQYELLERDRERQVAEQHVRWLDASYSDIQGVLDEAFPASGASASSPRAVLYGETQPEAAGSDAFKTRLVELSKLLAHYCEVRGARWVNVLLGNVKRAISGCYHAMRQAKYARRYLAEAAYRFNRRFRLAELLPRLARAMTLCKPWPEPKLRAVDNFHG